MSTGTECPACGPNSSCTCTNVERERWGPKCLTKEIDGQTAFLVDQLCGRKVTT